MEKKLRAFKLYIVIIGLVYLITPALLLVGSVALSYIVLIGILPLTALLCCAHYSMNRENDFAMCLIAPIFFIPAMFIYRIVITDPLRAIIYLIAYFLCGYLGLTVGDILANRRGSDNRSRAARNVRDDRNTGSVRRTPEVPAARRTTPSRVSVPQEEEPYVPRPAARRASRVEVETPEEPKRFIPADPYDDSSLDTSTTEDDIDAILREIHQRRG